MLENYFMSVKYILYEVPHKKIKPLPLKIASQIYFLTYRNERMYQGVNFHSSICALLILAIMEIFSAILHMRLKDINEKIIQKYKWPFVMSNGL